MSTPSNSSNSSSSSSAGVAPAASAPVRKEPTSFARRDRLIEIQKKAQAYWAANKTFEANAPADFSPPPSASVAGTGLSVPPASATREKFFATFPYPYMNGLLHIGHAFSFSKAEFTAGYQRLKGKNVLLPFAFHCTGMPILAAANKLKREIATGNIRSPPPPAEPTAATASAAAIESATTSTAAASATAGSSNSSSAPRAAGERFSGRKTKTAAKGGGPGFTQFEICEKSGLTAEDIPRFQDPTVWLSHFPPLGKEDLISFGAHVDWRRSFITTSQNPFYDSFVRWHFNTLRKRGKLGFGKRPTIYSPIDGQPCADHDRASGEGVNPQEYTLIKILLKGIPTTHKHAEALAPLAAAIAAGRKVFFVAATLRPETMYGQTNCFLLPDGEYGAFAVSAGEGAEIFICSERSARNMSYQDLSPAFGETSCLGTFAGEELLALPLSAPYTPLETVYTLPLLTISMGKGTGVVTSVPSDAPDDWAALRDLKEKPKLREKYGIGDEMVAMDVLEIVDIPGFGRRAAVKICDDLKIRSQNDAVLLAQAKEAVYLEGFYKGTMVVGKYAGQKVCDAKALVRADLISEGLAAPYWEPEKEVMSRSGDECVVAPVDQWYLKYGEADWRAATEAHVASPAFKAYNPLTLASFQQTLGWLKEWACSRSFGLGTKMPWDETFVVESLSDSTIYMAYYTVAHLLQGGDINPLTNAAPGPASIAPSALSDAVWDYIFLGEAYSADACNGIPEATLAPMRREFEYWYPMDLRVSGKDLIGNHLTMSLYNHMAIWGPGRAADRMPRSIFCNGHLLINGEKMSKSKGNFFTVSAAIAEFSADATRITLADAGDGLEDGNFEKDRVNAAILRLTTEEEYIRVSEEDIKKGALRTGELGYADKIFSARMAACIENADAGYAGMRFRDALAAAWYQLQLDKDAYRDYCARMEIPQHAVIAARFNEVQVIVLAPIAPHWCEFMWRDILKREGSVTQAKWPDASIGADAPLLAGEAYLQGHFHIVRATIIKSIEGKNNKKKVYAEGEKPTVTSLSVYVSSAYPDYQMWILNTMKPLFAPHVGFSGEALSSVKTATLANATFKSQVKKCMEFAAKVAVSHAGVAEPLPILSGIVPMDEYAVWTANADYAKRMIGVPAIHVRRIQDEGVLATDPTGKAKDVVPGEPYLLPVLSTDPSNSAVAAAAAATSSS